MRASLPATLLLSALLAACASNKDAAINTNLAQTGTLKVHPGLLGKPVPTELQTEAATPATAPDNSMKVDQVGLRTQRSVYFDLKKADIKADYAPALEAHGRYLAAHPQAKIRIEGNADERGSLGFNARLGLERAENVRREIINNGGSAKQVSIKSLGETHPRLKGHDEESWAENRRADVVYEKEE